MSAVRTVEGDVPGGLLGVCDAHDHLFFGSPRLPGQELRSRSAALAELAAFAAQGGGTVVQWTPYGLGRRAADLPALSRESGVRIVAATGLHQAVHYDDATLAGLRGRLAEVFVAELTEGIGTSGVRAGLIKVAGGFHALDAHARWTMTAAAEAHHATGAPIAVHLELGTGALDVLDLLCGELAVPPHRVVLGHLNRSPDLTVHREAAASGCYLAFDGPSRTHHATDWRMPDAVRALAEAGHGDRLLLGGDTTTAAARSVNGGPGMPYLLRRVRPRLAVELGEEAVRRILTDNPGRAFAVEWPGPVGP
ncbi:phosphotriesterase family protein [Streptomyces griseorubiginosus]|uniref:Phosphotriesterase homology protein n=1 Tax=Streptomyces griseorubiginosus TaxID=67304 RepID=A0AAI8L8K2_9ACTN|nr:phosphotriesterase [Streptomyces griseorubiginosus]AYC43345.1 Phosphotriesterase homology protein [Streptomyces griseorubiginosus]KUM74487.1 phosphotriesterase [Streptomyces griseorubiginosus]